MGKKNYIEVNTREEVKEEINSTGFELGKDYTEATFEKIYSDVVYCANINQGKIPAYLINAIRMRYLL